MPTNLVSEVAEIHRSQTIGNSAQLEPGGAKLAKANGSELARYFSDALVFAR